MSTVLIPGSFDPLHLGHIDIIDQAVELFGNVVVGVLYNYEKPSGLFTPDERVELAEDSLADRPTVDVEKYSGLAVQAAADAGADFIVKGLRNAVDFDIEQQMAHMNRSSAGVHTVFLPVPARRRVHLEPVHQGDRRPWWCRRSPRDDAGGGRSRR